MGFTPFWSVIGREQVMAMERQPDLFTNEPNAVLGRVADIERQRASGGISRSGSVPTSVSAHSSPAWSCAPSSAICFPASPLSSWPVLRRA